MSNSQLSGAKAGSGHDGFQPTSESKGLLINTTVRSFPGCAPGPRDAFSARCAGEPSPSNPSRLGAALGAAGARGAGGPEPSTPEVPAADPGPGRAAQGRGASGTRGRCVGRWRGPEQPRSGKRRSEGARRGSEGAASEGSASGAVTGTATGVKGAQLQEAGPPRRRLL